VEVLYFHAEAAKQLIIHTKHGNFLAFRTSEITSAAGLSGIIQQNFVWQSPGLLDLFCHPCFRLNQVANVYMLYRDS